MLNICEFSTAMHRGRKTMQKYLDLKGNRFRKDRKKVQTDHALRILKIVTLENGTFFVKKTICTCNQMTIGSEAQIRIIFKD